MPVRPLHSVWLGGPRAGLDLSREAFLSVVGPGPAFGFLSWGSVFRGRRHWADRDLTFYIVFWGWTGWHVTGESGPQSRSGGHLCSSQTNTNFVA